MVCEPVDTSPIIKPLKAMERERGARGADWNDVILRPLFSVSDIPA